jgi:hypothetical protein
MADNGQVLAEPSSAKDVQPAKADSDKMLKLTTSSPNIAKPHFVRS